MFQVGFFWLRIFRDEYTRGEFDGWEFSRDEFSYTRSEHFFFGLIDKGLCVSLAFEKYLQKH